MTNRPTLDDVLASPDTLKTLPLDVVALLIDDAKALGDRAAAAKKLIQGSIEARFGPAIAGAYQAAGKDTGTVRIDEGAFEIVADRTKKVEWDASQLADISLKIADGGDNPAEYIEISRSVSERKYTAWPEHIRKVFEPARTLKPGPLSIKLARKEAA